MIWFTSDWHFNHNKEFIYSNRYCASSAVMNEMIIANHNSIVKPEDEVYVLGDLILGGADKIEDGINLIKRMNGRLTVIRGNHDTDKRWTAYAQLYPKIERMEVAMYLKYKKYHFYLSHFPTATANYDDDKGWKHKTICLCGHSHTTDKFQDIAMGAYHCEVDAHFYYPVSIDEIIADLKTI